MGEDMDVLARGGRELESIRTRTVQKVKFFLRRKHETESSREPWNGVIE
jgi:hypothetical protein